MANIIGLQQQKEALSEINSILKGIAITNQFLEAENPSKTYSITFTDGNGKKHATELSASQEEIKALVIRYKAEKRKYVQELAEKYRIELDPEDHEILGSEN